MVFIQNIYDNDDFYSSYLEMRKNNEGLNENLEIPAFRSLLPDLKDKKILDLGCGYGKNCKWYVSQGVKKVIGVDISEKMIKKAVLLIYSILSICTTVCGVFIQT